MEERRGGDWLGSNVRGAALGSHVLGRRKWVWAKAVEEGGGVWHCRGHDGLTSGGSTGILLPLGMASLTAVGHDDVGATVIRDARSSLTMQFSEAPTLIHGSLANSSLTKVVALYTISNLS